MATERVPVAYSPPFFIPPHVIVPHSSHAKSSQNSGKKTCDAPVGSSQGPATKSSEVVLHTAIAECSLPEGHNITGVIFVFISLVLIAVFALMRSERINKAPKKSSKYPDGS